MGCKVRDRPGVIASVMNMILEVLGGAIHTLRRCEAVRLSSVIAIVSLCAKRLPYVMTKTSVECH